MWQQSNFLRDYLIIIHKFSEMFVPYMIILYNMWIYIAKLSPSQSPSLKLRWLYFQLSLPLPYYIGKTLKIVLGPKTLKVKDLNLTLTFLWAIIIQQKFSKKIWKDYSVVNEKEKRNFPPVNLEKSSLIIVVINFYSIKLFYQ